MKNFFRIFFVCFTVMQTLLSAEINLTDEEKHYLKNKKSLTVQNLSAFPPFNFIDNGMPAGYTIDYIQLLAKQLNVEIKFISGKPWREYLQMIKAGKLDIIPHIAVTEKRKEFITFSNFNHIEYVTGLAVRKNVKYQSMEDLKEKIIAVTNKTFLHNHLKTQFPNQSLLLTSSTSKAVQAVSEGKADAVIGSLPGLQYYIQKNWFTNVEITSIYGLKLPEQTKMPMGVAKNNQILKSILEKANKNIAYNEIVTLKKKWLNIDIKHTKEKLTFNTLEKNYLDSKSSIKMCVLPDWLPFEQIDENGKHKGIGADILKIITKRIGKEFVLVPTEKWSQSLQNIRDKKCDILPVAMDIPSRHDSMNFTKAYVSEPFVITTTNDKLFIKDETQLSNKKIGVVASYAFIEVLKTKNSDIIIIEVKNTKEGLEKVSSGKLFGYIDTMPTVSYFIQKYGMIDLKIAGRLDYDIALSIASRNDVPILNDIMQKALDTITEEEIAKIVGRWIEIKVHQEFDYKKILYITIFFLLIFILILYRNRVINKANIKLEKANTQILQQQQMVDKYVQILTTDLDGKITNMNAAYSNIIGYPINELIGSSFDKIRHPDMKKEFFEQLWKTIKSENIWKGEIKTLSKNGKNLYFNVVIEPLYEENTKIGYRSISENITDKKRIEELSITDKLTGLNNRLKIDELLIQHIDLYKRYNTPFSIILLDIDDFKKVNDTYGHDIGDYVLQDISKVLQDTVRATDEVGRWGGEEFIVICSNSNINSSFIVAEHIRKSIENFIFKTVGKQTVSLGVVEFTVNDTVSTLFKSVDTNLYQAKKEGKNKTIKS